MYVEFWIAELNTVELFATYLCKPETGQELNYPAEKELLFTDCLHRSNQRRVTYSIWFLASYSYKQKRFMRLAVIYAKVYSYGR